MGRIVLFLVFLVLSLSAGVQAFVDKQEITLGDYVVFTIESDEKEVDFPLISDIGGFAITNSGKSTNVSMVNGAVTQTIAQKYQFMPTDSVVIPSFDVKTDNGIVKTKPIEVKVVKGETTKDDRFAFKMEIDKKDVYVGGQVNLSVIFKRHVNADVVDLQYNKPDFKDLWVKQVGGEQNYRDGGYIVHRIDYVIFPQKAGKIKIPASIMRVGVPDFRRDMFGLFNNRAKYQNIISNDLEIDAQPLPDGVKLVGEFSIKAYVDKNRVESMKPTNLSIEVIGQGNIDDMDDFEFDLAEGTVYANKASKKYDLTKGKYGGTYKRDFAIIADKSFTIPPFTIKYFDPEKKQLRTVSSRSIDVEIINSPKTNANKDTVLQKIEDANATKESEKKGSDDSLLKNIIVFIMGFVWGGFVVFLALKGAKKKKDRIDKPIYKKIKESKSQKELLKLLIPYKERSQDIDEIISQLESAIYSDGNFSTSKQDIIAKIKALDLKKDDDCELL